MSARDLGRAAALVFLSSFVVSAAARASAFGSLRLPIEYRKVTVKADSVETDVTQLYLPVVGSLRLGRKIDLVVSGAFAQSTVSREGSDDLTLSGASDVTAQLFARLAHNRVLLQGGVGLPSGKKELDPEELAVAQILAHPLLGFRLKTYGQGLDLSGGAAAALPLGPRAALGLGAGFVSHGKFTLVDGGDDYQPGLESSVSIGLDLGGRASGKGNASGAGAPLRVDVSYRTFGKDQLAGSDLFQEGAQIEAQAALALGRRGPRFTALGRIVSKSDNTTFSGSGNSIEELKEKPGTSLRGDLGFDFPMGSAARLGVEGRVHQFSGADQAGLDGTAFGVGPVLSILFGDRGGLRLAGNFLGGSIDGHTDQANAALDTPQADLSGFSANIGLTLRGAP